MESSDLSRFTVVIPTFKREQFVMRQFRYWRESSANAIILDGSPSPAAIPVELRSDRIRYRHDPRPMTQRLADASDLVDTEFVALLADDEFFLHSGVQHAIRHLDSNPATIGCVGRCLYFFVDQGRFLVSDAYRDWKPFSQFDRGLKARLDADLPPNKTHMTMYGVFRRDAWMQIMSNAYQKEFSCAYTYERLMNLQRTILGPTDILESLLWMRSKENPPVLTDDWQRTGVYNFVNWARDPQFADEVARFRDIAGSMLSSSGISESEAAGFEERFFVGGVGRQAAKEAASRKSIKKRFGKLFLERSPKRVRSWAKRHLPGGSMRFAGWEGHSPTVMMKSLKARGTLFSAEELRNIEALALRTAKVNRDFQQDSSPG
ncbi:MAG: TIGR00180 family glycosyltransferase [Actinobacteria bacterium]|nr:TIGR00180 family glycosyltransferase [Actinomycetota bacterium]